MVVAAHPESSYSSIGNCRFPDCYDTSERDALFPRIRDLIDPALEQGAHVLLLGDFNVTEREPGYRDLDRGLRDAQQATGAGPGLTWGPPLPLPRIIPLLRIDYLLSSPTVTPLRTTVDCTQRGSDHSVLHGRFAIE